MYHQVYWVTKAVVAGCLFVLFLLPGCALYERFFEEEREKTPSQLVSEGVEAMESGYYDRAAELFQMVRDRYPYSPYAMTAELKAADALYIEGRYEEAFDAYSQFEKLHPTHQKIPYVIYQEGMCHFSRISTIDRDQSPTRRAKEVFQRLVDKFPETKYASKARLKIRKCYIYLAKHELYVGDFYYKMGHYKAAINRYRYLLENYPDFGQYQEALKSIRRAKQRLAERKEG